MIDEDEDEGSTPRQKFLLLFDMLPPIPLFSANATRALSEALYTHNETHDFAIDNDMALLIWKIVEWSRMATADDIREIML